MSYTSERIDDKSYPEIAQLLERSFGLKLPVKLIEDKYNTRVFGLSNVGLFAKNEKQSTAAYYGVFPVVLSFDGKEYIIAQSGDTMTAPEHRKKGLFTRLAKETYSLAKDLGIQLIYGFPNNNSYPGFKKKLDWKFNGFMHQFSLTSPLALPFCELAAKYPLLSPLYKKIFDKRVANYRVNVNSIDRDIFNHSHVKGYIKKSVGFLTYKTTGENAEIVQIDGFTFLIKARSHLYICEVNKIREDEVESLIKSVKKLSKKLACRKAIFLLSENHWLYSILSTKLISKEYLRIGYYIINTEIDAKQIQFSASDFDLY